MQKILITGASGFVGSRFVERWRNDFVILAPSHAELDITDAQAVERYIIEHAPQVVLQFMTRVRFFWPYLGPLLTH